MYVNVAIGFGIGLVPFFGDIADAIFKANSRNYALLYEFLHKKGLEHPVEAPPPKQPWLRRWFGHGPDAAAAAATSTHEPSSQATASTNATAPSTAGAPPVPVSASQSHVGTGATADATPAEPARAKVGKRKDKPLPAINFSSSTPWN